MSWYERSSRRWDERGGARVVTSPGAVRLYPEALAPGTRVGRWRVVEPLGVGGQGAVYRVEDIEHPGDFYALKLAWSAHDGRAEREVELVMTRAAHPHVVGFHGLARWPHPREGCLGFVMDWVPGLALDVWAEREGTTFRRLATVGAMVASTLGELHERGVLHRDLKPEHILVRESDGQPVLLDFGVGWYEGAARLTTGPLPPATLHQLTPEAVRFLWKSREHPGTSYAFQPGDDLYALGVCLYRAATGYQPFPEGLPADLLQMAIIEARPMAPVLVNPRVPRALSDVIVRLLSKDPARRYPSGAALHEALVAAARGGDPAWDASIFEWEEVPPAQEGAAPRGASSGPRGKSSPGARRHGPPFPHAWSGGVAGPGARARSGGAAGPGVHGSRFTRGAECPGSRREVGHGCAGRPAGFSPVRAGAAPGEESEAGPLYAGGGGRAVRRLLAYSRAALSDLSPPDVRVQGQMLLARVEGAACAHQCGCWSTRGAVRFRREWVAARSTSVGHWTPGNWHVSSALLHRRVAPQSGVRW
ncbi:serine/threonine protein kinase [Cystobacter fuscus]